ncbi:4Fe-4S binding protein [Succinispira mobilis]|uniref:4Fe-4S binding protein n=1 Tax=Succinispira mobilis TaxID=78120 RepID=UPI00035CCF20
MRKILAVFFVLFLFLASLYPVIGIFALICMLAPPIFAVFSGRFWCGNFCPRGAFLDLFLKKYSRHQTPPKFLKENSFRIFFFLILMSLFTLQLFSVPNSLESLGLVFIKVIFLTSLLGIILGLYYIPRTWCMFCPMGSLSKFLSLSRTQNLFVKKNCIDCKKCSKVCPLHLQPYLDKGTFFQNSDCLKCGKCISNCPVNALSFEK